MKMAKRAALIVAAVAGSAALAGGGVAFASAMTTPSPQIFQPAEGHDPAVSTGTAPTALGHERNDSRDDGHANAVDAQSAPSALRGHDADHEANSPNDR